MKVYKLLKQYPGMDFPIGTKFILDPSTGWLSARTEDGRGSTEWDEKYFNSGIGEFFKDITDFYLEFGSNTILFFTPRNENGVLSNIGYSAKINAKAILINDRGDGMIEVKWLNKSSAKGQRDGAYFKSMFSINRQKE